MMEWLAAEWPQVLGFSTGAVCVLLAARRNIWTYPIGVVNNLVFLALFLSVGIYATAGLQIVYLAFGLHGWWRWSRGAEQNRTYIGRTPPHAIPVLILAGLSGATVLWWVLITFTDSQVALADAATTAGSLVAQYMLNRKWIENWFVWIAVDVAFIGLSLATGLVIIAVLYGLFILMCLYGWVSWRRIERSTDTRELVAASGDARD
ncbi:MAG: nicotinamide mononucleotide transporter [Microbacteriaceae bacterium]|nr:nicotinamide mononucleotide transporter [Microbacteriaceae bacterium]